MKSNRIMKLNAEKFLMLILAAMMTGWYSCKTPQLAVVPSPRTIPSTFDTSTDTSGVGSLSWRQYFSDPYLTRLIDTALENNQELAITLQELEIAKNEIRMRQGALLPSVTAGGGIGVDKAARYTSQGAGDASTDITPDRKVPDWLPDFRASMNASWEIDIWKKLRNARQAAVKRYLATVEGKNFVVTTLVAEVANTYYELLALDNQLSIVKQTIMLQKNALEVVKVQKQAAAATELAVKKFEAEVLNSESLEYQLQQKIKVKEYELNNLIGRYPRPIERDSVALLNIEPAKAAAGIPYQMLKNRPDIKQAELEMEAAHLDVAVAKAEFYPSLGLSAAIGIQAFNPAYWAKLPESLLFSLAGDVVGPIINKAAIKAEYANANARQIQALYNYDRTVLNAYTEVVVQLSNMDNYNKTFELKSKEVNILTSSNEIANSLFKNARADYLEVLLNQRDALDAKLELVENRLNQYNAMINLYRAVGGGWN